MAESTIFDDVFRTETEKMPELTIPLIRYLERIIHWIQKLYRDGMSI